MAAESGVIPRSFCNVRAAPPSTAPLLQWSRDPALRPARAILDNLRHRRLYRFVDEILVPVEWTYRVRARGVDVPGACAQVAGGLVGGQG
jgi:hypothetical protein